MSIPPASPLPRAPRLLDQARERVRYLRDSLKSERACVHGTRAFVHFHDRRRPSR